MTLASTPAFTFAARNGGSFFDFMEPEQADDKPKGRSRQSEGFEERKPRRSSFDDNEFSDSKPDRRGGRSE